MKDIFEHDFFKQTKNIDLSMLEIKDYKKNEIIYNENDQCNNISLIISGSINIYTYTYTEKDYSIATLKENDMFGQFLLFSKNPYYLGNIVATQACRIVNISKKNLLALFQKDITFLENALELFSNNVKAIQERVKILAQKSIKDSVMFYLKEKERKTGSRFISIPKKEILAKYLNIPRPSLSRVLIELQQEKVINSSKNIIEIIKK